MRILHTEHGGLPDLRVEKSALLMKREGHELIFLGGKKSQYQNLGAFDQLHQVPIGNDFDVAVNPLVKRKWLKTINKIKPDIIHAHNVLTAHFLLGTEYPVIYDDHEWWSQHLFKYAERKMPRGIASRPLMHLIPRWEKQLLRRYPTFTPSENIASEHRKIGRWVEPLRNFPLEFQIRDLPNPERLEKLVYTGCDFKRKSFQVHRNMQGLRKILKFQIICGLQHREMMEELVKYKIGLIAMVLHPFHKYSDPNRNYEYMHAGLQVVANSGFKHRFPDNPYVNQFTNYDDIRDVIDRIPEVDPLIIMKYAQENYLWDNHKKVLHEAYKIA